MVGVKLLESENISNPGTLTQKAHSSRHNWTILRTQNPLGFRRFRSVRVTLRDGVQDCRLQRLVFD